MNYVEVISRYVGDMPEDYQREVFDFVDYLREKRIRQSPDRWIERAWGISPDFPDRPAQATFVKRNIQS